MSDSPLRSSAPSGSSAPRTRSDGPNKKPPPNPVRSSFSRWVPFLALIFLVNLFLASRVPGTKPSRITLPYSSFTDEVARGNVASVSSKGATIEGELRMAVTYPPPVPGKKSVTGDLFRTERPTFATDDLLALLRANKVTVDAEPDKDDQPFWVFLVTGVGPTLLLIGVMYFIFRRSASMSGLGDIGRSKAELYVPGATHTTFDDVAGIDEVVDEMREIVDFLRDPQRYRNLGGTIPKGVLLTGPPGTGKTLLARALAGEAGVPFFSMAASEFIEMIVGVGASRVRDLFDKARAAAPSIIFIDELDAVGRARGGSVALGGHDEREQTLNQILTEMDGFTGAEGVIVVAATNRAEILDPALLRPGRFDRHVVVNPPDVVGREAILRVHTRSVPLARDVDLGAIAAATPGMVGADLRNLVNEGALLAARRRHETVTASDLMEALERIQLGAARHLVLTLEDRTRTAVHESGHALLGMLLPGADPVRKISIIPRGRALGVTFQSPERDRYSFTEGYLRGRIVTVLGGRVAEELKYGDVTTGAEDDLQVATALARRMVGRWGMSDAVGPVSVLSDDDVVAFGQPVGNAAVSDETMQLIDSEVRKLIEECEETARQMLRAEEARLDRLVTELIRLETLDTAQAYDAAGLERRENHGSAAHLTSS